MKTGFKSKATEIQKAMELYGIATKKDEAEILNRAGKNIAFRAAQFTPVATKAQITSELSRNGNELAYKILSKRGKFKGISIKERSKLINKLFRARNKSTHYIRVGWGPAIQAFGGNASRIYKVGKKIEEGRKHNKKAAPNDLKATLVNNAHGANKIAVKPLEKAIAFVVSDMTQYAIRKLFGTAKRFSA